MYHLLETDATEKKPPSRAGYGNKMVQHISEDNGDDAPQNAKKARLTGSRGDRNQVRQVRLQW